MKKTENSKEEIIKRLIKIASNFDSKNENYLVTYPHFLNYFKNIDEINIDNLIIGISFTYSWMPTILKSINLQNSEKTVVILNEVKKGKILDENELLILKRTFNNSLVGTSKLLHFINPDKYAIWDSRVFRFLNTGEMPYKYKLEKPEIYLKYLSFIDSFKKEENFNSFYILMKEKVGFEITENRALELAFFKGESK
nr:hypothetical protein [uncultured Flavobacterium sp.]